MNHSQCVVSRAADGSFASCPDPSASTAGTTAPTADVHVRDDQNATLVGTASLPNPKQTRAAQITQLGALAMRSRRDGEIHTISLTGEIDVATAGAVERELWRIEATDTETILVDLTGLTFLDSTGIRMLLHAQQRSRATSNRLMLLRPPQSIQRVLRITGVHHLLPFAD